MANDLTHNPVVLDTFTSAIDLADYFPGGIKLYSIQWVKPTTVGHTCIIKTNANNFIEWECHVAKETIDHYYNGLHKNDLNIDVSGVGSGKLIITYK